MAAGRTRRAAREAMRREFMMAGGPIDAYTRLRSPGSSERGLASERRLSKVPGRACLLAITCCERLSHRVLRPTQWAAGGNLHRYIPPWSNSLVSSNVSQYSAKDRIAEASNMESLSTGCT